MLSLLEGLIWNNGRFRMPLTHDIGGRFPPLLEVRSGVETRREPALKTVSNISACHRCWQTGGCRCRWGQPTKSRRHGVRRRVRRGGEGAQGVWRSTILGGGWRTVQANVDREHGAQDGQREGKRTRQDMLSRFNAKIAVFAGIRYFILLSAILRHPWILGLHDKLILSSVECFFQGNDVPPQNPTDDRRSCLELPWLLEGLKCCICVCRSFKAGTWQRKKSEIFRTHRLYTRISIMFLSFCWRWPRTAISLAGRRTVLPCHTRKLQALATLLPFCLARVRAKCDEHHDALLEPVLIEGTK